MAEYLTIKEIDEALGLTQESIALELFDIEELGGVAIRSALET